MRILYSVILYMFFFSQIANAWMMPGLVSQQEVVSGGGEDCTGYLVCQGFEGTGYDNSETWTTYVGTPDPDYTTTVLVGSQSLFLNGTVDTGTYTDLGASYSTTGGYMKIRFTTLPPSGSRPFFGLYSTGTQRAYMSVDSSGVLYFFHGSNSCALVDTVSIGVTYSLWYQHETGTGADGVYHLALSTNTTKPPAGNSYCSGTNGTNTTDINRIIPFTDAGGVAAPSIILDYLRVDDATIGSDPS